MKIKDLIAELESALHAKGNVEVMLSVYEDFVSPECCEEPTEDDMNEMIFRGIVTSTEPSDYLLIKG